jgi:hypothetical protein
MGCQWSLLNGLCFAVTSIHLTFAQDGGRCTDPEQFGYSLLEKPKPTTQHVEALQKLSEQHYLAATVCAASQGAYIWILVNISKCLGKVPGSDASGTFPPRLQVGQDSAIFGLCVPTECMSSAATLSRIIWKHLAAKFTSPWRLIGIPQFCLFRAKRRSWILLTCICSFLMVLGSILPSSLRTAAIKMNSGQQGCCTRPCTLFH